MKLHLPSVLRKALLSSIAALAAALPGTLASGVLATGFCSFSWAAPQDMDIADEASLDDDEEVLFSPYQGDYTIAPIAMSTWTDPDVNGAAEGTGWASSSSGVASGNFEIPAYSEEGENSYWYTVGAGTLTFANAGNGITLKLQRTGNLTANTVLAGSLNVKNLWLTSDASGSANHFRVESAVLGSDIENIVINQAGLRVVAEHTDLNANFIIGTMLTNTGLSGSALSTVGDSNTHTALWIERNLSTSGNLVVQQNANIAIVNTSFTVGELQGSGDLKLLPGGGGNTSYFVLTNGGENFSGKLLLINNRSGNSDSTIQMQIGAGQTGAQSDNVKTLCVYALEGARAHIYSQEDYFAKLVITGASAESSASYINIDSGVTLELRENAKQILADSSLSGGLNLLSGAELTLSNSTAAGSVNLARGSVLVCASGSINLSGATLNVSGDSSSLVSIQVDMAGGAVLNLGASNLEQLTAANFSLSFINGAMSDGWEYKLLDLTGLDYTDSSSEFTALQEQIVGMLSSEHKTRGREFSLKLEQDGDSTYGTLHLDVTQCTLTWKSGSSTWSEGVEGSNDASWRGEIGGSEQDTYFARGDHAIFNLASGGTVTINGSVTAGDVTISNGGTWSFSGADNGALNLVGNLSVAENTKATFTNDIVFSNSDSQSIIGKGTITLGECSAASSNGAVSSGTNISSAGKLIIGGDDEGQETVVDLAAGGQLSFAGGIEVKEGSKLIISGMKSSVNNALASSWSSANTWISGSIGGAGTVEFSSLGYVRTDNNGPISKMFSADHALNKLIIGSGTAVDLFGNNDAYYNALNSIQEIHIADGASLVIESPMFAAATGTGHTLYLEGYGDKQTSYGKNNTIAARQAALCVGIWNASHAQTIGWNVELADDAAVYVGRREYENVASGGNAHSLTLTGTYKGNNHKLVLIGRGVMILGDSFNAEGSGEFDVVQGILTLNNTTNSDALANYSINVQGETTQYEEDQYGGSGSLSVGDGTFTIKTLTGSGNVSVTSDSAKLVLSNASGAFSGTISGSVEMQAGSWNLSGATFSGGSSSLTGVLQLDAGGVLSIAGGSLDISGLTSLTVNAAQSGGATGATIFVDCEVEGTKLTLGDSVLGTSGLTIQLALSDDIYELFTEQTTSVSLEDYIAFTGSDTTTLLSIIEAELQRGYELVWNDGLYLQLSSNATPGDLIWQDDSGSTWAAGSQGSTWDDGNLFYTHDNVSFVGNRTDKTQSESITVASGGVAAGSMSVSGSGAYTFTGGSIELQHGLTIAMESTSETVTVEFANAALTVAEEMSITGSSNVVISGTTAVSVAGGATVGAGSHLTISTTGAKNFGSAGISVASGAVLTFANVTSLTGPITGEGTLELSMGAPSGSSIDNALAFDRNGLFGAANTIMTDGKVKLVNSTVLSVGSRDDREAFNRITSLTVTDGTAFVLRSNANEGFGTTSTTLYLAGHGLWNEQSGTSGLVFGSDNVKGALAFALVTNNAAMSFKVAGNVELLADASVHVTSSANYTGVLSGQINANGHKLVKTGGGALQLSGTTTGTAGSIQIEAGTLSFTYNATTQQSYADWAVSVDAGATFNLGGNYQYQIADLSGAGSVTGSSRVLRLTNATGTSAFTGTLESGVTVEVGSGIWKVGNATLHGAVHLSGGTLDLTDASSLTVDSTDGFQINVGLYSTTAALKLTSQQIQNGALAEYISFTGFDFTGDAAGFSVQLLDVAGISLSDGDLDDFLANLDDSMLGRSQAFELSTDGILSIVGNPTDLVWGGGDGDWTTKTQTGGDNAANEDKWNITGGESNTYFGARENVTFGVANTDTGTISISGAVIAGRMTVATGSWIFADKEGDPADSLVVNGALHVQGGTATFRNSSTTLNGTVTVESGAELAFAGAAAVTAQNTVTVKAGGTLRLATSGTRTFSQGIAVEGTLVVQDVSSVGVISGSGTLAMAAGSYGFADSGIFAQTNTILGTGTVELMSGATLTIGSSGLNTAYNRITTLKVADGGVINFGTSGGSLTINRFGEETKALILAGNGAWTDAASSAKKGALIIDDKPANAGGTYTRVGSAVRLAADASVYVGTNTGNVERVAYMEGTLNLNNSTLTKTGVGTLELSNDSETMAPAGDGKVALEGGKLHLNTKDGSIYSGWEVNLATGTALRLGGNTGADRGTSAYTLKSLSGDAGDVILGSAHASATLTLNNTATSAGESNTYAGGISAGVKVQVPGGYEKLSGTLSSGSNYAASGGGTLALAGTFGGVHELVADGGTLDLADATVSGSGVSLLLTTANSGSVNNLSLGVGATLRVAAANADAAAVSSVITLGGATKLAGGSILQFDVAADTSGTWGTVTRYAIASLQLEGATAASPVKIHVNPYGRDDDGEVALLSMGDHVLISGAQLTEDQLEKFVGMWAEADSMPDVSAYGKGYRLKVDDSGNLVLSVEQVARSLVWDNAAGGVWSNDPVQNWHIAADSSTKVAFMDSDVVTFGTLDGAESVAVTVSEVKVGGITVVGSTSYRLEGAIGGLDDGSGAGLVVGTKSEAFTGTLTLTGANSWGGDNAINSGTVVVENAAALSSGATSLNGGTLELNLPAAGAALTSRLLLNGGSLLAKADARVEALLGSAAHLSADSGATLQVSLSADANTAGDAALGINKGTPAHNGTVSLSLGTSFSTTGAVEVAAGALQILRAGAAAASPLGFSAGSVSVAQAAALSVGQEVQLSADHIAAAGEVEMQENSSLLLTGSEAGSLATVKSAGAVLLADDVLSTIDALELAADAAATTLGGDSWTLGTVSGSTAALTIAADVSLTKGGAVGALSISDAATLGVDAELSATTLSMGSAGSGEAAAELSRGVVSAATATIAHGVVAENATLKLAAAGSTVSGSGSVVKGSVELEQSGATLSLEDGAALSGSVSAVGGSRVNIAADAGSLAGGLVNLVADAELDLNGSAAAELGVSLVGGGSIAQAGAFTGSIVIDDALSGASSFALGGAGSAASITLHNLRGGSTVSGLGDGITLAGESALVLEAANMERAHAFLQSAADTVSFALADGAKVRVVVNNILDDLRAATTGTYYIFNTAVTGWQDKLTFDASMLVYLTATLNDSDGSISFTYADELNGQIFDSSAEQDANGDTLVSGYDELDQFVGVVVNKKTDVTLGETPADRADGLVMRNVVGTARGELNIEGVNDPATGSRSLVTLQNTITDDDLAEYAKHAGVEGMAVDNSFTMLSDVNVNHADLQIKHATLDNTFLRHSATVMEGELKIEGGDLLMTSGVLELRGHADVEAVKFAQDDSALVVNATTARVSSLELRDRGDYTQAEGSPHAEHVRVVNEGVLELKAGAYVGEGLVIGNTSSPYGGAVSVAAGGEGVSISVGSRLVGVLLNLDGALSILEPITGYAAARAAAPRSSESITWDLAGITGAGSLDGSMDMDITVAEKTRTFSGDIHAYAGTMRFNQSPYEQVFSGVTGGLGWNVVNNTGGRVVFDLMGGAAPNTLTMGNLTLNSGSYTTIWMDLSSAESRRGIQVATLTIAAGADVTIGHYQGTITLEGADGDEFVLGVISPDDLVMSSVSAEAKFHLKGVRNAGEIYVDGKDGLTLKVRLNNSNMYLAAADNVNSRTGAAMLWSLKESRSIGGDLGAVDAAVLDLLAEDTAASRAQANRLMAAVAGSGLAAVGQALSGDLERQLRGIRNRTTGLIYGGPESTGLNFNTWLNAEANFHKQKADGLLPGVKTNGWGGTVGMHLSQGANMTLGLALTAMYNDIETDGADRVKGDMDTQYLSGFLQVASGAWRHTFVGSMGLAEVDVTRTVNYGDGSYKAHSSTDGLAFGLMYEVGYALPLNGEGTLCLQPVFNVAWRYTQLAGFTETGSSAALNVGDQQFNAVTLGLGARMQAAMGESVLNRLCVLEARALAKVDLGDRRGEAEVALAQPGSTGGKIRGAERGVAGLELGLNLSVPITQQSEIFVDCTAELRSSETEFNATIGYKLSF